LRRIRCHYPSGQSFIEALDAEKEPNALEVYTTERFEPGEEMLCEIYFSGLAAKMMIRAIGMGWHNARPRLRVRAGGVLRCGGGEWRKLQFIRSVATGAIDFSQRRRHMRHPVLVEIRWRRAGTREFTRGTITELSETGALLLTKDPPTVDEELIIAITPPGSARPVEVLSFVRNNATEGGAGVEFMARDMGGVHRLREVIRRIVEE
jgi:hypothetical protein